MKKYGVSWILSFLIFFYLFASSTVMTNAEKPIKIVIDPGHGGENLGAEYTREDGLLFTEKEMTLITSLAMKEELEKYDNVEVIMTREQDVKQDISLKDRVTLASEENADFLVCLHFNMSISHILYGAEMWVPSQGELYSKGASLAYELLKEYEDMGIFNRGIKTRLNDKGTDYYGILRHAATMNVPAVLVEHCHLDHSYDHSFYETEEALKELGRRDATAVAKYFKLVSTELGNDFSDYETVSISVPDGTVKPDTTEPEICDINLIHYNEDSGEVTIQINASDSDSGIQYYTYSIDGGTTWELLSPWGDEDYIELTIQLADSQIPNVKAKVYNLYDINKESEVLALPIYYDPDLHQDNFEDHHEILVIEPDMVEKIQREQVGKLQREEIAVIMICVLCILIMFLFLLYLVKRNRTKKSRKRKTQNHNKHRK